MFNSKPLNQTAWATTLVSNDGKTQSDRFIDRLAKSEEKHRMYIKAMQTSPRSEIKEHNAAVELKKLQRKKMKSQTQNQNKSTPSSHWHANDESDPHKFDYSVSVDEQRANLPMGNLTDDNLAHGAFMNYANPIDLHGIVNGTAHSPIAWMTSVKERIRWLSRLLERTLKENNELKAKIAFLEGKQ